MKRVLTTGEVGQYCGVHFRTVSRWIAQGKLKGYRLPGGRGDYRVPLGEFIAFLRRHGLPVPTEFSNAGRVLVVHRDPGSADSIDGALKHAGYETKVARDALQAGVLLNAFAPGVMVLDLAVAGGAALDTLQFLRSSPELANLKVLALADEAGGDLGHAIAAGATDVLSGPFSPQELLRRVGALAGGGATGRGGGVA